MFFQAYITDFTFQEIKGIDFHFFFTEIHQIIYMNQLLLSALLDHEQFTWTQHNMWQVRKF